MWGRGAPRPYIFFTPPHLFALFQNISYLCEIIIMIDMSGGANDSTAYLSNNGRYIIFEFRDKRVMFLGPKGLEKFVSVNDFEPSIGYMAVMTKYSGNSKPVEEYIDLLSTLDELHINRANFLQPIKYLRLKNV